MCLALVVSSGLPSEGLEALFPVPESVEDATKPVGGRWNFNVQLHFSSYDSENAFH
jgi:hypothetical protein